MFRSPSRLSVLRGRGSVLGIFELEGDAGDLGLGLGIE